MAGFESREPARLYEPLNGFEIKQQIKKIIEKVLDGDGNLTQSVVYPIYGVNIKLEFFTGGAGMYQQKDWTTQASELAATKGLDIASIVPEDVEKRLFEHQIRVDGIETPADLVREQVGLPIPIPVATGEQGYVQITAEQQRPRATRTAQEEINELLAQTTAEELVAPTAEKTPMKPNKLSGAAQRKGMTPQERDAKLKSLQEG